MEAKDVVEAVVDLGWNGCAATVEGRPGVLLTYGDDVNDARRPRIAFQLEKLEADRDWRGLVRACIARARTDRAWFAGRSVRALRIELDRPAREAEKQRRLEARAEREADRESKRREREEAERAKLTGGARRVKVKAAKLDAVELGGRTVACLVGTGFGVGDEVVLHAGDRAVCARIEDVHDEPGINSGYTLVSVARVFGF